VTANATIGRVLCVDDEPHILRAFQWLLNKNFEIHVATGAAGGLRLLRRYDFDVVVCDYRMPGVTGTEFLTQVCALAPRARRFLMVACSDVDSAGSASAEGADYGIVTKPWDPRSFPAVISEAVEVARSRAVAVPAMTRERAPVLTAAIEPIAVPRVPPFIPAAREIRVNGTSSRPRVSGEASATSAPSVLMIDEDAERHGAFVKAVAGKVLLQHAFSLAEAMAVLSKNPVCVVVTRMRIGRMDARHLLELVRQVRPETCAVVLGDETDATLHSSTREGGQIHRVLPRMPNSEFIISAVESGIERHRALIAKSGLQCCAPPAAGKPAPPPVGGYGVASGRATASGPGGASGASGAVRSAASRAADPRVPAGKRRADRWIGRLRLGVKGFLGI